MLLPDTREGSASADSNDYSVTRLTHPAASPSMQKQKSALPNNASLQLESGASSNQHADITQRRNTEKLSFQCHVCSKVFQKNAKLKLHLMSHTGEKPFKCSYPGCTKAYSRKNHLDVHALSHAASLEERKPFKCTFGSRPNQSNATEGEEGEEEGKEDDASEQDDVKSMTSTVSRLVRSIGGGEDDSEGPCGMRFSSLFHLNRHLKAHRDPLPHKCTFNGCFLSFAKAQQLKKHEATHTGLLPYKCTDSSCEKRFAKQSIMLLHAKSHSEEARYMCGHPNCPTPAFTKWSLLQAHIKTNHKQASQNNNAQASFPCFTCGQTFTVAHSLKTHIASVHAHLDGMISLGVQCTVEGCGKVFSKKSNLQVHIRAKHELLKPHKCRQCDAEFAHKHLLSRHSRSIHNNTTSTHTTQTDGNKCEQEEAPVATPVVATISASSPPSQKRKRTMVVDTNASPFVAITGFTSQERPVACPRVGCVARFRTDRDLGRHLEANNGTCVIALASCHELFT